MVAPSALTSIRTSTPSLPGTKIRLLSVQSTAESTTVLVSRLEPIVTVGRSSPLPRPSTVTPARSRVMPPTVLIVSAWPSDTRITSPLLAVHLATAASMVRSGRSGSEPSLLSLALAWPESTCHTLPFVGSTGIPRL